MTKRHRDKARM